MHELDSSRKSSEHPRAGFMFVAAIGLLALAVIAPLANFGILQALFASPAQSGFALKLPAFETGLRTAVLLILACIILDIIIAWALYFILKSFDQTLSLLAALFRIIYAGFFAVALSFLIVLLVQMNMYQAQSHLEVLGQQAFFLYQSYLAVWNVALILFGVHLLLVGGIFCLRVPKTKILGALLLIAGAGYIFDGIAFLLLRDFPFKLSVFTFIGEVVLIFWLFRQAIRERLQNQAARQSSAPA